MCQVGVLPDLPDESVVKKARLEPGKMFLVDLEAGKIVPDDSVKEKYANRLPYAEWIEKNLINIGGWTEHSQANGIKVRVCVELGRRGCRIFFFLFLYLR